MDLSLMTHTTLAQSSLTLSSTWNPVLTNLLVGLFLVVSIAMILLVLIQRPQGGGLSGAFGAGGGGAGGAGAGQTAFGTKTGDVLTMGTITIFVIFLITAIVLNFATRPQAPANTAPAMTTPVEGGTLGEPVEDEESTDAQGGTDAEQGDGTIADPEQAIEDTMNSTPSIEGETGDPGADAPGTNSGDEPAGDPPAGDDN